MLNPLKSASSLFFVARRVLVALVVVGSMTAAARAQTGNGTVTEPVFPTVCPSTTTPTVIAAETTIVNGEPASETDDTLIQPALTFAATSACPAGSKAVELTLNANGNNAFVIKPIAVPVGVTLIVDAGVTVFASKVASEYQVSSSTDTCGVNGPLGTACYPLISLGQASPATVGSGVNPTCKSTSNPIVTPCAALMGYGVINGRGYDAPVVSTQTSLECDGKTVPKSWWDLADAARCGLTSNGNNNGTNQNNPTLVYGYKGYQIQLYKITIVNSPMFHVKFTSDGTLVNNFVAWGVKVLTPWSARNTDGIDPGGAQGAAVVNSVISDGDDEIAISGSSLSENYSFTNLLMTSGHGLSIGSSTKGTVSNVLVNGINISGQYNFAAKTGDPNNEGLRIKSYCGTGGAVTNVTYENVCMQNVATALDLNTAYSSSSTSSSCPTFGSSAAPITFKNIDVLTEAKLNFAPGSSASVNNTSTFTLDNVYFNSLQSSDLGTPKYDAITLADSYYPSLLAGLANTGNSVTETSSTTNPPSLATASPITCAASNFPTLIGELEATTTVGGTTTRNLDRAISLTIPATLTLNAVVEPTVSEVTYTSVASGTNTAAPVPTGTVQFYDNGTAIGSPVALSQNGTLASYTVGEPMAGSHVYTAAYTGDANYAAQTFSSSMATTSLAVTVTAGPAAQVAFTTAPATTVVYGVAPGTVAVQVQDAAGDAITSSTAAVTLTVTGPNGYSASYSANAVSGTATFSAVANPPGVGAYVYTAISSGLASATANETVSAATLTVSVTAANRIFGAVNPAFGYTVTGFVNGDPGSVVTGAPVIATAALRNSAAGTSYPTTITQGTLAAANYVFSLVGGTLTVTGGAAQVIHFLPLPPLAHGGTYQLTATASSGLPVTYTVSGPASVSGSTLNVTGTGPVTVTAAQAGNVSYAAAANVAQTFTAP